MAAAIAAAVAGAQALDAPAAPGGQGGTAAGPSLSEGELAGLRRTVQGCWYKSAVSSEAQRALVVIKVTLAANADVINVELLESTAPSDAATRSAFETARRSLRCLRDAGLPPEKYETWKEIEFEFDYSADRVR